MKVAEAVSPGDKTSIIFTLNNNVGGLARALQVFQELGINVLHLELQNSSSDVEQVKLLHMYMIRTKYRNIKNLLLRNYSNIQTQH